MGADRSDRNGLSMGVGIGEYVCIRVWIRVTGDIASYCFKLDMCAQQGVAADAATRRQDRGVFEGWIRPDGLPDLSVRRR
jgi:hypothetical protein